MIGTGHFGSKEMRKGGDNLNNEIPGRLPGVKICKFSTRAVSLNATHVTCVAFVYYVWANIPLRTSIDDELNTQATSVSAESQ